VILAEITINGVVNYISIDGHGLVHNWKPRIIGFDAPTISIPSNHGGYAKMTFGSISFNPDLFSADWPPPVSCAIDIYYTDTTEAARELLFSGTAHLSEFNKTTITYGLYGPSYDETIADATSYNDTLNDVLTAILTTIAEIITVDTTYARATSPNVTHAVSGETPAIDLASAIAEFYSHLIYVSGSTAYLIDMKLDNGIWTMGEYDFAAGASYKYNNPLSKVTSDYGGTTYDSVLAYAYGSPLSVTPYHTTKAGIEAALADILAIENSPRISLSVPLMAGNFPDLGEKIIIPDTQQVADLSSWIRARKIVFDFFNDKITIEGEGAIAA
jgi:hypothetical protein